MRAVVTAVALAVGAMVASAAAQPVPVPQPAPKRDSTTRPPSSLLPAPPALIGGAAPALMGPAAQPTGIFNNNQRALVGRVSAYLSTIQTLSGNFVQVGPDGSRLQGQFYIQKPGKVRFEYNPPSLIDVIADGQSVVVRDRKLATQDLYPLSQTPLRYLLSEHIDLLRDTNLVSVSADDTFVTLVLNEKQPLVGSNRLMLMFGAKDLQLRQWTVTDPQGYDTTIVVYNLDTNKRPDPGMFKIDYDNPNLQNVR